MTLPSSASDLPPDALDSDLKEFIEKACASDPFKVEQDLGLGFVKLRSSEAERRQAAQDIQSFEDVVIEVLRNSRDVGAKNIFLATGRDTSGRTLTIIDDGEGIPEEMWQTVFEPRVTSKLDTAHMDKWGMHGRGMALFSIRVNVDEAFVAASQPGLGTSIHIKGNDALSEKADQSTFPRFEESNGVLAMRGPKNIVRTCCEFALEHRGCVNVFFGSHTQIASTLYHFGMATVSAFERAFGSSDIALTKQLSLANSAEDLAQRARALGLDISERSARRILEDESDCLDDLLSIMKMKFDKPSTLKKSSSASKLKLSAPTLRLSEEERELFLSRVMKAYDDVAQAYYLSPRVTPTLKMRDGNLIVQIPLVHSEEAS